MTRVKVSKRYVVWVDLNESGDVESIQVQDNENFEVVVFDLYKAPEFVVERIALLKLTDVNKLEKGELIGRKLHDDVLVVYLTYDEYQQIKEECK
jgi:hypothetical protein